MLSNDAICGLLCGILLGAFLMLIGISLSNPDGPALQRAFKAACIDVPRDQKCKWVEIIVKGVKEADA